MKKITETSLKLIGFVYVFMLFVIGFAILLRVTYQALGFALICCVFYGIFLTWLQKKNYFVGNTQKRRYRIERGCKNGKQSKN